MVRRDPVRPAHHVQRHAVVRARSLSEPRSLSARRSAAGQATAASSAGGWFVYIVRCADRTLYTGVAKDVRARVDAHNAGRGAKYTRTRLPVKVVYEEGVPDRGAALRREHAIKRLPRLAKLALVRRRSPRAS